MWKCPIFQKLLPVRKEIKDMPYKMLIAEDEQEEYELVLYLLNKLKLDSSLQSES